jgi:hypothetical protein
MITKKPVCPCLVAREAYADGMSLIHDRLDFIPSWDKDWALSRTAEHLASCAGRDLADGLPLGMMDWGYVEERVALTPGALSLT